MPGTTLFCSPLKGIPKPAMIQNRQNRFANQGFCTSNNLFIWQWPNFIELPFKLLSAFPRSRQWRIFSSAHGCKGMFSRVCFLCRLQIYWGLLRCLALTRSKEQRDQSKRSSRKHLDTKWTNFTTSFEPQYRFYQWTCGPTRHSFERSPSNIIKCECLLQVSKKLKAIPQQHVVVGPWQPRPDTGQNPWGVPRHYASCHFVHPRLARWKLVTWFRTPASDASEIQWRWS